MTTHTDAALDPVFMEVMRHHMVGLTEEMNITMRQTTRSVMAKEVNDFSSALLDASGTVVAQAVPYGLTVFTAAMRHVIDTLGDSFRPGDAVITNDPYHGASHLSDILVAMPVIWRGALVGFAATFQHHTDIGGRFPGGYGAASTQLYEEGLSLPVVRYCRDGRVDEDVRRIIAANVRAPEDVLGDLDANVAACRRGVQGLTELLDKYGRESVQAWCDHLVERSARQMEQVVRSIPNGTYRVESAVEDGAGGTLVLVLTLIIAEGRLTIDFTGSAPQSPIAFNVPPGLALHYCGSVLFGLLRNPDVVINGGIIRDLNVVAPRGSIVNPAFPAAVASRGQVGQRLREMMLEALALAAPGQIPAVGEGGPSVLVYSRTPTEGAAPKVLTDIWLGGWGARPTSDGIDGVASLTMTGFRTSSGELMELQTPVVLDGFGFVPDTGGAGTFRGALSVYRRFRFLEAGRVMLRTCRPDLRVPGPSGGGAGGGFSARLIHAGVATQLPLRSVIDVAVEAGDVIEHITPGGSGFGDARSRDPRLVLEDVLDDKVSVGAAESAYGVAIDVRSREVDTGKTERLRGEALQ